MKTCARCRLTKQLSEFHKSNRATGERSPRGGMGVESRCKQCCAEARKPGITRQREIDAARAADGLKHCAKCEEVKQRFDFHRRVASPDGLAYKCIACVNADSAAWRERNPGSHQLWYNENREHKKAYWANWRAQNKQRMAVIYAKWAKANPHKVNALIAKRTAAKLQATPAWADQSAIERIYAEAARLTKETGERHEVDHIVPLQGRIVRGLHWEGNLQVLPKAENISKHNRYWPGMP